jgi:hypothetical protein
MKFVDTPSPLPLSRWERGNSLKMKFVNTPSPRTLQKVCKANEVGKANLCNVSLSRWERGNSLKRECIDFHLPTVSFRSSKTP